MAEDDVEIKKSDLGYEHFPERFGKTPQGILINPKKSKEVRREHNEHEYCENQVLHAVHRNPFVKFLMKAMESQGCKIDLNRHICCEQCTDKVSGGYDQSANQMVICENRLYKKPYIFNYTLVHEMIHMFDYCRAETELESLDHLACTEIRAVNMYGCPIERFKHRNQELCVRNVAVKSMMVARNITKLKATEVVDPVFEKCYNDLEPFGRKLKSPGDVEKVFQENCRYGLYDMHAHYGTPPKLAEILRRRTRESFGFVKTED